MPYANSFVGNKVHAVVDAFVLLAHALRLDGTL